MQEESTVDSGEPADRPARRGSEWIVTRADTRALAPTSLNGHDSGTNGNGHDRGMSARDASYAAFFSSNHAVMLLIEPRTGRIVDANPAACRFYGYDHDAMMGMTMSVINPIPPEEITAVLAAAWKDDRSFFDFRHRLSSGEMRDVEVTSGPIVIAGRHLIHAIIHDATPRRLAEHRAERFQRLNAALIEIGSALGRLEEPEALYREACRLMVDVAGLTAAFIALREPQPSEDLLVAAASGANVSGMGGQRLVFGLDFMPDGLIGTTLRERRSVVLDLDTRWVTDRLGRIIRGTGVRSTLAIPLLIGGELRGIAGVFATDAGDLGPKEAELLERLVGDLGSRVESIERNAERLAAEARFRILIEQSPIPIGINRGDDILYGNPAYMTMMRPGSTEMDGRTRLSELFAPSERDAVEERRRRHEAGEPPPASYDTVMLRADGSSLPVRIAPVAIELPDGPAVAAFMTDLSERRAAEEAIRASELRYRTLVEQASDAIFVMDPDGTFTDANTAGCRILGYTREELQLLNFRDIVPPEINPGQDRRVSQLDANEPIISERLARRRDGSLVPLEVSARRLPDGRIHSIARDLTARRKADAERERLATAVDQATDSILMTDPEGRIVYVNPAFTAISGYESEEVLGRRPKDVLRYDAQPAELFAAMDTASAGGEMFKGRVLNRHRDGTPIELDLVISQLRAADGTVIGSVEVGRDVTREQALEAQLRQAQKMEAVGRLAGGVAHDFNNLLTAISGYAALLADGLRSGTADSADLEEIRLAADRAAGLTRQLLAFARRTVLQPRVVDLRAVVQGLVPMLGRLIGEDIELVVTPGPPVGRILADPGQLEQVIMNLALNARDAMPAGGRLMLETVDAELDAEYVAEHADATPGSYVALLVSDTGSGMTPDVLEHIFEPFFTTKEKSKGTGLGLSTAFGIVKQSKGHIAVYTEPGRGSTFRVYLPRIDAAVEPVRPTDPFDVPGGNETILVVEDEEALRHLACRLLERHGYAVLAAANAPDALEIARRRTGPIDLLLTDVVMPGLSGPELAAAMESVRPGLPVLFTSGYTEEAVNRLGAVESGKGYLGKPFTLQALLGTVRELLDRRAGALGGGATPGR